MVNSYPNVKCYMRRLPPEKGGAIYRTCEQIQPKKQLRKGERVQKPHTAYLKSLNKKKKDLTKPELSRYNALAKKYERMKKK